MPPPLSEEQLAAQEEEMTWQKEFELMRSAAQAKNEPKKVGFVVRGMVYCDVV